MRVQKVLLVLLVLYGARFPELDEATLDKDAMLSPRFENDSTRSV